MGKPAARHPHSERLNTHPPHPPREMQKNNLGRFGAELALPRTTTSSSLSSLAHLHCGLPFQIREETQGCSKRDMRPITNSSFGGEEKRGGDDTKQDAQTAVLESQAPAPLKQCSS